LVDQPVDLNQAIKKIGMILINTVLYKLKFSKNVNNK
jgi:hypothetical protein